MATLATLNDWSLLDMGPACGDTGVPEVLNVACTGDPECDVQGVRGVGMGWALEDVPVSVEGSADGVDLLEFSCAVLARGNGRLATVPFCRGGGLARFPAIVLLFVLAGTRVHSGQTTCR